MTNAPCFGGCKGLKNYAELVASSKDAVQF